MSNFKLNLPTDIPWQRKCVSEDMLDLSETGGGKRPYRWRSSVAVFEYEPDSDNQNYVEMTITYLKVVCSITGYQERPQEIGLPNRGIRSYWKDAPGIVDYLNKLEQYYACFGAILEVTVSPEGGGEDLTRFPFFLDFEPKKRELYQVATDSNERQSRSIDSLNVTKSAGSTQSLEVFDIDMGGGGFGAQASVAGTGGGFNYQAPNGQWGTKRMNADESLSSRSSDVGQEKRETFSHSTQISQLYHQLDSYHLGTNRALFFILPRPNTLETEHTFVNGIRNIEGIQEFFLVVARPKDVPGVCVNAYLETGHIGKVSWTETEEVPGSELTTTWPGSFDARPRGNDDETTVYDDKDRIWAVDTYYPGQGYKIKSAVLSSPGPTIRYNYDKPNLVDSPPHISSQTDDYITVSGRVHSGFKNYAVDEDRWEEITYPFSVAITLMKTQQVQKSTDTLFMTGRELNCCGRIRELPYTLPSGIVYERPLETPPLTVREPTGLDLSRQMHSAVQAGLRMSVEDTEHRYATPVPLARTDFAAQVLANVSETANVRVASLPTLSEEVRGKLAALSPATTVADLLGMPVQMQRDVLGLSGDQVMELRDALTGASYRTDDAREAWLSGAEMARLFRAGGAREAGGGER